MIQIFSIAIFLSLGFAHAEEANLCKDLIQPNIGQVTADGKLTLKAGLTGYDIEKNERSVTLKSRSAGASADYEFSLDDRGRIKSGARASGGFIFDQVKQFKTEVAYRNGRCYVQKITESGRMKAHTDMCHELGNVYGKVPECVESCDAKFQTQLTDIVKRFSGDTYSADAIAKWSKMKAGSRIDTQAKVYLDNCTSVAPIRAALEDKSLWITDATGVESGASAALREQ